MHSDHLHSMVPLERYREIVAALISQDDSWLNGCWLRFAAQAAVLCPDHPPALALHIRHIAASLGKHAHWYNGLGSAARFVVAAMLIQHHITVHVFLGEQNRLRDMLKEVGLNRDGLYETLAALILRLSPDNRQMSLLQGERLKAIHDQMKQRHWWLTGHSDLPACAALAQCPGSAREVVARAEEAFQALHDAGLMTGKHLQRAAHILTLTELSIDQAVSRYRKLKACMETSVDTLAAEHYEVVAILTMLHQPAERVIDVLHAVRKELDLFQPDECGDANLIIAADLTFLDLVRFGEDGELLHDAKSLNGMLHAIHTFHMASAIIISQIEPALMLAKGGEASQIGWPYAIL